MSAAVAFPEPTPKRSRAEYEKTRRKARHISENGQFLSIAFNRQSGKCYWCGEQMVMRAFFKPGTNQQITDPHKATLDHVEPLAIGGATNLKNGVAACFACNQLRSQFNTSSWIRQRNEQEKRHRADYSLLQNWMLTQLRAEQEKRRAAEEAVEMHLATIHMESRPETGWQKFLRRLGW